MYFLSVASIHGPLATVFFWNFLLFFPAFFICCSENLFFKCICLYIWFYDCSFASAIANLEGCRLYITFSYTLQVEPSPTTGSLSLLHQTAHGSVTSAASSTFPVTTVCFNTNTVDDRKPSFFEFKPHNRSNMVMNYLMLQLVKLMNINLQVRWTYELGFDGFFP